MLLGYRDRNVHELLCHEVASRTGEYESREIVVDVVDGRARPDVALSAGLGGSLLEAVSGRRRWQAVSVQTVRPLFWLWTRCDGDSQTPPRRMAGHPEDSIVWKLTLRVARVSRADPDGLDIIRFPVGSPGDRDRLRALLRGDVDAAVLGSSHAPAAIRRLGLTPKVFFGDVVRFPTAGIAVDTDQLAPDDRRVRTLIAAQHAAIDRVRRREPVVVDAVMALLGTTNRADAEHFVSDYLAPAYGVDASEARAAGSAAVEWLNMKAPVDNEAERFYTRI
jgi:hypothetical protein